MRLAARGNRDAADYLSKRARIDDRLASLVAPDYNAPDCRRLAKHLIKHRHALFTFLDDPAVAPDNNRAEREGRPAVIALINSFNNTGQNGAQTQAVLMSIYCTLKLRACDPIQTIAHAFGVYITTGKLPVMPRAPTAPG